MTTKVQITNEGPGDVTLYAVNPTNEERNKVKLEVLPKGVTVEKYVWSDLSILIQE